MGPQLRPPGAFLWETSAYPPGRGVATGAGAGFPSHAFGVTWRPAPSQ
jgi:hypothetical protein